jgi:hypothetical protein
MPFRYVRRITESEVWKMEPRFAIAMLCWRASFEIV